MYVSIYTHIPSLKRGTLKGLESKHLQLNGPFAAMALDTFASQSQLAEHVGTVAGVSKGRCICF